MRGTLNFPALVAAKPPRHTHPKLCLGAFQVEVDIPDVDPAGTDLVMSVQYQSSGVIDYRQWDGRLYKPTNMSAEKFLERASQRFLDRRDYLMGHIIRDIARRTERVRDEKLFPPNLKHNLKHGMNSESAIWQEIVEMSPRYGLAQDQEKAIEAYRSAAMEVAGDLICMAGQMWIATSEPCYVGRWAEDGSEHLATVHVHRNSKFYERGHDQHADIEMWEDTRAVVFGAGQLTEVEGLCTPKVAETYLEPRGGRIEVHQPELLRTDFDAMELDRHARLLAERLATWVANPGRQKLQLSAVNAWADLCEHLDGYMPGNAPQEETEGLLERVLAEAGEFVPWLDRACISRALDRVRMVPIELEHAFGLETRA